MSNELTIYSNLEQMKSAAKELAQSNLLPDSFIKKPENVLIALQYGNELGLQPMQALKNIIVINNKPSLSADIMVAIAMKHSDFKGIKYETFKDKNGKTISAKCTIKREFGNEISEFSGEFSLEDAERAGLLKKDIWIKYPIEMLENRAKTRACKRAYPDALSGFYTPEEERENIENEIIIKPEPTKEEVMQKAVDNFKDAEEPVYETVTEPIEESKEFAFTDAHKSIMKPSGISKFNKLYIELCEKKGKSEVDDLGKILRESFDEFTLTDFNFMYKIMDDINKSDKISDKLNEDIKVYLEGVNK